MSITNHIKPISYIKSHAAEVLQDVHETKVPYVITQHGEAKAVLMDTSSYDSLMESIKVLKLLQQGEKDVVEERVVAQDTVFSQVEKIFDL